MQFVLIAYDKAGALPLRMANRPAHLAYLQEAIGSKLLFAGPLLDDDNNPKGSILVVEAADEEQARAFFDGDPYAVAGLFQNIEVSRFRLVFTNGVLQA